MKHLYKFVTKSKHFFLVALVSFLFNQSYAQVACSSCTSNDFQFNSFYIGDAAGIPLSGSCTVGSPVTAHLWMNVTNSSTRYSLKVYYDIQEYNPMTTATTTTNVNNCLYDNVAIPNTLIDLGTITYTCGNQLTIANFQMHWKQNNSISCSFDAPKCLCVPPTVVAAQLASSFSYAACNNGVTSSVTFTSNVIGGTAPFTYNWNFGDMTSSSLANPTKTYTNPGPYTATLTVTDANGVVSSSNQSISFPAQNVAPSVTVTQPTCSVSTGTITITSPTGSGITYSKDGGTTYQSSATFSGVTSGNYNMVYKNAAGCVSAVTVATVNSAPVNPAAPSVTVTQPTCSVSTGTITVTAPTGIGITYSIDGINYQSSTTFSGVASGTYSVTAKSSGGCVSTATSAVVNTQPSTPAAPTLSVTQPTCTVATGTITISAPTGGGVTYSIDGINYQSSNSFTSVAPGSYSVTAKSTAGCVSTATSAVVNAQPSTPAAPTLSVTQPTCTVATGTITISAPTGVGITYSIDGINYQSSPTFSGVSAGSYSVRAKSGAGCISTITNATVNTQPSTPTAPTVSVSQPSCSVATGIITVTAPSGGGITYSIDGINYQSSATFSGVAAGTYSVTAKSTAGCVSTATSATVNAQPSTPATPTISAGGPLNFCAGDNVVLTSSSATGNQWYLNGSLIGGATNQTYTATTGGNYTVIVTNLSGCSSSASAITTVTINPNPIVTAITGGGSGVCEGSSITLSSTPSGGVWSSSNTSLATINPTTGLLTGISAGTATITYTVTNGFGCSSSANTNVTIAAASNATVVPSGAVTGCAGSGLTLTASSAAGYQWYKDGVLIMGATGQTYSVTSNGSYHVVLTNASGCVSTSAATMVTLVTITPTTINVIGNTALCSGSTVQLCPAVWGWSNYQWYLNGTAIAPALGVMSCITVSAPGIYTLEVQDGAGCWSTPSTGVTITSVAAPATPTISAGGSLSFCAGGSVLLTSSSATNNQWYLNGGIISGATNQTYTATQAGTYTVTVTNGACSATSAGTVVIIDNLPAPTISVSGNATLCNGGSVLLTSSSASGNQWYLNGGIISGATNQTYTATVAGTYTVTVTNGTCITNSNNSIVVSNSVAATPSIATPDGTNVCIGGTIQLCPASWGYSNYQWYKNGVLIPAPAGTSSCLTIDDTGAGNYTLTAQNGAGCWSAASLAVTITTGGACAVSGGGGGGVESKSLGNVISTRLFGNAINNKSQEVTRTNEPFVRSTIQLNGPSNLRLVDITPTAVVGTTQAFISSPTDLVNYTNALEVLSVDYLNSNITKAVAFATRTSGDVYNHTKQICDRLKGAELREVKSISVRGYTLMAYKIRQRDGKMEYAINLHAGVAKNRNTISLQSKWFTDNYTPDETMFNYQLWATSYATVSSMASDIIAKLQAEGTVQSIAVTDVPTAYVSKGSRNGEALQLTIQNNTNAVSGYFELKEKVNEQAVETTRQVPFNVTANGISNLTLPVADNYEASIYMYLNNKLTDLLYLSDGSWNVNYNATNTSISQFAASNESGFTTNGNEYRLMRNATVAGTTKDYVSVYKTLHGGGVEKDLSSYKSLSFNATTLGVSSIKVTIVKKGITNWSNQYSYTFNTNTTGEYTVNLSDFADANGNKGLNANDVLAVNFGLQIARNVSTNINATISKARFSTEALNTSLQLAKLVSIFPNPTNNQFTAKFVSELDESLVLRVIDAGSGKTIKTVFVNAKKGMNTVLVNLTNVAVSNSLLTVTLNGDSGAYPTQKVLLQRK